MDKNMRQEFECMFSCLFFMWFSSYGWKETQAMCDQLHLVPCVCLEINVTYLYDAQVFCSKITSFPLFHWSLDEYSLPLLLNMTSLRSCISWFIGTSNQCLLLEEGARLSGTVEQHIFPVLESPEVQINDIYLYTRKAIFGRAAARHTCLSRTLHLGARTDGRCWATTDFSQIQIHKDI